MEGFAASTSMFGTIWGGLSNVSSSVCRALNCCRRRTPATYENGGRVDIEYSALTESSTDYTTTPTCAAICLRKIRQYDNKAGFALGTLAFFLYGIMSASAATKILAPLLDSPERWRFVGGWTVVIGSTLASSVVNALLFNLVGKDLADAFEANRNPALQIILTLISILPAAILFATLYEATTAPSKLNFTISGLSLAVSLAGYLMRIVLNAQSLQGIVDLFWRGNSRPDKILWATLYHLHRVKSAWNEEGKGRCESIGNALWESGPIVRFGFQLSIATAYTLMAHSKYTAAFSTIAKAFGASEYGLPLVGKYIIEAAACIFLLSLNLTWTSASIIANDPLSIIFGKHFYKNALRPILFLLSTLLYPCTRSYARYNALYSNTSTFHTWATYAVIGSAFSAVAMVIQGGAASENVTMFEWERNLPMLIEIVGAIAGIEMNLASTCLRLNGENKTVTEWFGEVEKMSTVMNLTIPEATVIFIKEERERDSNREGPMANRAVELAITTPSAKINQSHIFYGRRELASSGNTPQMTQP
ncbi:MAG: hypothetical protein Q7V63_07315 [Gammaproteobacteria bacterium]|nr:hypothetical protein [Gammaproteobacteria bacterium]